MLAVASQADTLFQVIHVEQMIFPLRIEHTQHDHALVIAQRVRADELFFGVVTRLQQIEDGIAQFLAAQSFRLQTLGEDVYPRAGENRIFQTLDVPVFRVHLDAAELIEQFAEDAGNIILKNQIFLVEALEQAFPQTIYGLALFVHHIVIFEQMFAGFEVLRFHGLLRRFDSSTD